ncbi:hypothetical protein [Parasutterella sp.]|uniref:hypothetical protein n=1 Tax=Parasutterella sp. TaxID=2049037 RepID=UPI003991315B
MKKLRPEFVAAMAQIIRLSADGEITLETIKKCCDQGIKRLENAANSNEYENGESVLIFVDYDRNGKEGVAYFNARIKEDFYEDSEPAPDKETCSQEPESSLSRVYKYFEIEDSIIKEYGKLVPLNRQAARQIWKELLDEGKSLGGKATDYLTLQRFVSSRIEYLIKLDSMIGGCFSEIGESLFTDSAGKNSQQSQQVETVGISRDHKLIHQIPAGDALISPVDGVLDSSEESLKLQILLRLFDVIVKLSGERKL